ncbi:tyrosine-type recombinase/integrase [Micromonospora aurantiaca]|nr:MULTISPECIES: tyrosine-type recombinase/integrase [Micromonospora]MDG4752833.1 tyrosine-type recombinase/integrase [Micromonospora sp. WMMD718]
MRRDDPGSASLVLAPNVVHLDPAPVVFEEMLRGWATQQRSRFLAEATVTQRLRLTRRLAEFSGLYPWQWTPAEGEAFIAHLRGGDRPLALSTARAYEVDLRMFCEYLLDARYGWASLCVDRFGMAPQQVFHQDNSVIHVEDYEGDPSRRPLTYDELQALFDAADGRAEQIRARGVKGALSALRDAAMLKLTYAFGLRRREVAMLDLVDVRSNPKAPQFGRCGMVMVRYGKASRGGPPRRRTVLLVPEMDWMVPVVKHWLHEVRPALGPGKHPALWVTERRGRVSTRLVNEAFVAAKKAAGLDPALDPHCLRHSYVTHLVEFDYPVKFVQDQVGHKFASTTAIYTGVSNEYRNQLLQRALQDRLGRMWEA